MYRWLALLLLLPGLATAQMYRWTDENGKVHFSDHKPGTPQQSVESVDIQGPPPIGQDEDVRGINERLDRLRGSEQRQRDEVEQARQRAEQQRRKAMTEACARQRRNLKILSGPVMYRDQDGRRHSVSVEQVTKDRNRISDWIAQNCNDVPEQPAPDDTGE